MDVFFQYASVTEISLYNCSALPENEFSRSTPLRRPVRGVASFIFGSSMIIIYIACLRVMVKLGLVRKACYKIMFVIGLYEIVTVSINDIFFAYSFTFGFEFCDAPNTFYIIGCVYTMCWTGTSFFCLYLALNRMMEILDLRRQVIDIFYSPVRTSLGILLGIFYSIWFVLFTTPPILSADVAVARPSPLGFDISSDFELRFGFVLFNNFAVATLTVIFYGLFSISFRRKIGKLGFPDARSRLQHQVFIQSTLMCAFNFGLIVTYVSYYFLVHSIVLAQICLFIYQFTSGFQALLYLFFNQTILDGVKDDLFCLLRVQREVTTDMRTYNGASSEQSQPEGSAISVAENEFATI